MPSKNPYSRFVNPGFEDAVSLLGTGKYQVGTAKASHIYFNNSNSAYFCDFTAGLSVAGLGHNTPAIHEARRKFLDSDIDLMELAKDSQLFNELKEKISNFTDGNFNLASICDSGAHAVEQAIQIALSAEDTESRPIILYCSTSYHGKTLGALSLSGQESSSHSQFPNIIEKIPFQFDSPSSLQRAFAEAKGRRIVVLLEPIIADCVGIPSTTFMETLGRLAKENKAKVIFDEIFVGLWRTGKKFAFEHYNLTPDFITLSKSFGGTKASVAAVLVNASNSASSDFQHEGSLISNLDMVSCLAALDEYMKETVETKILNIEQELSSFLTKLRKERRGMICGFRGKGGLFRISLSPTINRILSANKLPKKISSLICKVITGFSMVYLVRSHKILVLPADATHPGIIINAAIDTDHESLNRLFLALKGLHNKTLFGLAFSFLGSKLWR